MYYLLCKRKDPVCDHKDRLLCLNSKSAPKASEEVHIPVTQNLGSEGAPDRLDYNHRNLRQKYRLIAVEGLAQIKVVGTVRNMDNE